MSRYIPSYGTSPTSDRATAATRAYEEAVSDGVVVFWTDIFLLGILGLFALFSLPRAISRFRQRAEWWKGLVLCEYLWFDFFVLRSTSNLCAVTQKMSTRSFSTNHQNLLS